MNASNRNERNGPPLSVTIVKDGQDLPRLNIDGAVIDQRVAEHRLEVGQGVLDASIASCWLAVGETWNGCSY